MLANQKMKSTIADYGECWYYIALLVVLLPFNVEASIAAITPKGLERSSPQVVSQLTNFPKSDVTITSSVNWSVPRLGFNDEHLDSGSSLMMATADDGRTTTQTTTRKSNTNKATGGRTRDCRKKGVC